MWPSWEGWVAVEHVRGVLGCVDGSVPGVGVNVLPPPQGQSLLSPAAAWASLRGADFSFFLLNLRKPHSSHLRWSDIKEGDIIFKLFLSV